MSEINFTFRVDPELKQRFSEVAKSADRSASVLLRDFMRAYVQEAEHDAWMRREISAGLAEAADPSVPRRSHDAVAAGIAGRLKRSASGADH